MEKNLLRLCRRLDYTFKNIIHLKQALTHCSAGPTNNERFEFLGDSVLSLVIAYALFLQFPYQSEGELSRLRAYLVKGEMLASIALEIELGEYLYLGQGELKSGGFRRASILADALEAIFAAIYLDGGLDACKHVILHLYHSRLNDPHLATNLKDAKTRLQEYLQSKKYTLPEYKLIDIIGEEHDQIFHVMCEVKELHLSTQGKGETRRKAEQAAARILLQRIKSSN